jgi:hypothetical protein
MPIRTLLTITGLVCLLAALAASPASARQSLAQLRVEGPGETLDPGTWYVTGTEQIRRSRSSDACIRRKGTFRFRGPTALGIARTGAEHRKPLRQVRVRRDEAGFFVCEIGSIRGRPFAHPDGFAGWSYWLDFEFGSQAADLVDLDNGDRVLWVYGDFGSSMVNTGDTLELRRVPARDGDGSFEVKVVAHAFNGGTSPASGATIEGAESVTPLGSGRYEIEVGNGFSTLRATRGPDIPSNQVRTCFRADKADCPSAHGRRIFGSSRGDEIRGTKGWDRINSGKGKDRIDLTTGGDDRVHCGRGEDFVAIATDTDDDFSLRSCERVIER